MNRREATAALLTCMAIVPPALAWKARHVTASAPMQSQSQTNFKESSAVFPLAISGSRRYLQDAAGRPFLMTGDTAWSLIAELKRDEVDVYLSTRQQQGFNTLLVNLIEHHFSSNPPADAYGEQPFRAPGRFSEPNDRYFDNAYWILRRASELGFLILLVPAYLGAGGGDEGWYVDMKAAGLEALRAYGRYVSQRYRDLSNIIWVHGGDHDDPDRSLARAVAGGIVEADSKALQTVHSSRDTVTPDYWRGESWLSIDTVYTYGDVFEAVASEHARGLPLPIVMIEAIYENEHGLDEQRVRAQAYGAILGGAAGQIYGNNPVWHFSGPGLFFSVFGWRHALDSSGASSIGHLRRFFEPLEWWKIEPDHGVVLADGEGRNDDYYAICGIAADRSFAVIYASYARQLTVKTPWSDAKGMDARWYDPAAGLFADPAPIAASVDQGLIFTVPDGSNASGYDDWLLLLTPAV